MDKVSNSGGAKASSESAYSFFCDDSFEATNHAGIVLGRVELHAGFDHIDGAYGAVGNGAADTSSKSTLCASVVHVFLCVCWVGDVRMYACARVRIGTSMSWHGFTPHHGWHMACIGTFPKITAKGI